MKIAIVQVALSHGGAERVGALIANGLSRKGNDIIILTDLNEPVTYKTDSDVVIHDFAGKKANKYIKWLKTIRKIRRIIKEEKPDAIIGIMGLCTLITYIACLGMRIPIVMTEHYGFERPDNAPLNFKQKFFKFHINKLYSAVTVLTEADRKAIGNRLGKVFVMPNPLFLTPVETIPHKEKIVLAAGHLDRWFYKGFDILLQAWSKIHDSSSKFQDWWLKIAGNGEKESFEYLMNLLPDGEWVYNDNVNDDDNFINTKEKYAGTEKQKSQKCGVWRSEKYHIEFLGFQKDMESLYKKSKIFVLSSRYEGFGLVLIEAMSQGCAPIACDFKGRQREILCPEGVSSSKFIRQDSSASSQDSRFELCENGMLCKPEDVEALASAIGSMIKDEDYRQRVQQHAIERSKFYALDNIIIMWEKLFKTIS